MIRPIQNNNYEQNFTGSIKRNPAIRAIEKQLQKASKNIEHDNTLEFYNFIREIKNDNTNNTLIVTTSKKTLDVPTDVKIEIGSKPKTKTIHKYTVTKVKYGNMVREYSEQIYDLPSFKLNLGRTIKHNLIKFGEELFGERSLNKLTTENLRQCNRLNKKIFRLLEEIKETIEQLKHLDKTNFQDFLIKHEKLSKKVNKKQATVSQEILKAESILKIAENELPQLTLDLLK